MESSVKESVRAREFFMVPIKILLAIFISQNNLVPGETDEGI
jgi:hypothetical protein